MRVNGATIQRNDRQVLTHEQFELRGMMFRLVRERIAPMAQWDRTEPHHVFFVHRAGQLRVRRVDDDGLVQREVPLRPGDVWVLPADRRFQAQLRGDSVEFVEIVVPQRVLGDLVVRPGVGARDGFLREAVNRLFLAAESRDVSTRLLGDSLAESVRLHIRDRYTSGADGHRPAPRRLSARKRALIAQHLEAELASDISLERLAELCEMPVAPFVAGFTAAFGTTPYQYVLDRRIEAARRLLATSDLPIAAVGTSVGFSTASHFASTFRQRVGVTPSEYRAEATR